MQYADDTVFVLEGCRENATALKWILECFELLSGLSVNFDKSKVIGFNIDEEELGVLVGILGCRAGVGLIPYLGLKVGGRIRWLDGWKEVIERARHKLKRWDAKTLSMAGRATLIQSTISVVPLYWLSFLPAPKRVVETFRSMQSKFLWGGDEGVKKIAWLRWRKCVSRRKKAVWGSKTFIGLIMLYCLNGYRGF